MGSFATNPTRWTLIDLRPPPPLCQTRSVGFSSPLYSWTLLPFLLAVDTGMATKQPSRGPAAYPRRRAVRACQVCRARRTKCDNKKPACSFCEKIGAKCVVNDPTDMSVYATRVEDLCGCFSFQR